MSVCLFLSEMRIFHRYNCLIFFFKYCSLFITVNSGDETTSNTIEHTSSREAFLTTDDSMNETNHDITTDVGFTLPPNGPPISLLKCREKYYPLGRWVFACKCRKIHCPDQVLARQLRNRRQRFYGNLEEMISVSVVYVAFFIIGVTGNNAHEYQTTITTTTK